MWTSMVGRAGLAWSNVGGGKAGGRQQFVLYSPRPSLLELLGDQPGTPMGRACSAEPLGNSTWEWGRSGITGR